MANILILYGSMTGHTKFVANMIRNQLSKSGREVKMQNVMDFKDYKLGAYDILLLGCSTWDEGKLQMHFEEYMEELNKNKPKLGGKKFAMFGCADSGYVHFGEGLNLVEKDFAGMGAVEITKRLLVDGDPETNANIDKVTDWTAKLIEALN